MFLIITSYITDPAQVEPHRKAHGEWVKRYIDEGVFLFAGPKKSKLGGVILAKGVDRARLLRIIAEDSYVQADLVENQVVEFSSVFAQAGVAGLVVE